MLNQTDFEVGQQGDVIEDSYCDTDTHHYIAVPEHWTKFETIAFLKLMLEAVNKLYPNFNIGVNKPTQTLEEKS